MTPQATAGPELPSGWVVKSSGLAEMATVCSAMPFGPLSRVMPSMRAWKRAVPSWPAVKHGQVAQVVRRAAWAAVPRSVGVEVPAGVSCGWTAAVGAFVDVQAMRARRKTGERALNEDFLALLAEGHEPAGLAAFGRSELCLECSRGAKVGGDSAA